MNLLAVRGHRGERFAAYHVTDNGHVILTNVVSNRTNERYIITHVFDGRGLFSCMVVACTATDLF